MTNIFERNLAWLKQHAPEIAKLAADESFDVGKEKLNIDVVEGKDVTISVNGIQLTSRHDRTLQAEIMCSHISDADEQVHVYGPMLGDCVRWLLSNRPNLKRVYVHILNLNLFRYLLQAIDLPRPDVAFSDGQAEVEWVYERNSFEAFSPRVVSVSELRFPDEHNYELAERLDSDLERSFNSCQFSAMSDQLKMRIRKNLDVAKGDADVSQEFGKLTGQKIAVLGSGPSLEVTEDKLRMLMAQGVKVIAADTATRWMAQRNLKADYVVSVDFNILPDVTGAEACRFAKLVYSPMGGCEFIRSFPSNNRLCFYCFGNAYEEAKALCPHTELYSSGSVIHPAVDFAVKLGAAEVYLFGCDFAFSGDKTHAGATKEFAAARLISPSAGRIPDRGQTGETIMTTRAMRGYRVDLGDYICRMKKLGCGVRFVNMSPWGAAIRGTESACADMLRKEP